MGVAVLGALAAIGGSASFSYRQTRRAAVESMEQTTGFWVEAIGRIANGAQTKLQALDQATHGEVSAQTAATMRRLVLGSSVIREA